MKFTQRCLNCSHVLTIELKQKKDKPLQKPKGYKCSECDHEGKYGEALKPKVAPIQTISDEKTPPVFDENNNPCLMVNGKRLPFTLGRIELLKKKISQDMAKLEALEKTWALECKDKESGEDNN